MPCLSFSKGFPQQGVLLGVLSGQVTQQKPPNDLVPATSQTASAPGHSLAKELPPLEVRPYGSDQHKQAHRQPELCRAPLHTRSGNTGGWN